MNNHWQLNRAVFSSVSLEFILWCSFIGHRRRWSMLIGSHILCEHEHNANHVSFQMCTLFAQFFIFSHSISFPFAQDARNRIYLSMRSHQVAGVRTSVRTHTRSWCSSHKHSSFSTALSLSLDNVYCEISNAPVFPLCEQIWNSVRNLTHLWNCGI